MISELEFGEYGRGEGRGRCKSYYNMQVGGKKYSPRPDFFNTRGSLSNYMREIMRGGEGSKTHESKIYDDTHNSFPAVFYFYSESNVRGGGGEKRKLSMRKSSPRTVSFFLSPPGKPMVVVGSHKFPPPNENRARASYSMLLLSLPLAVTDVLFPPPSSFALNHGFLLLLRLRSLLLLLLLLPSIKLRLNLFPFPPSAPRKEEEEEGEYWRPRPLQRTRFAKDNINQTDIIVAELVHTYLNNIFH